ncbi:septation ring formation regulator EzrA [Bacillus safensis]|nr:MULTISPECIES: septation ring formation regulator EzrA [Bacillus]AWI35559.1 septation ring formation regulator EzrA [Bacillus safensis FO-36b]KDE25991.1 Septation ring formation regulator ezrA [Bacillus safensis FO-36b]KKD40503.1 septation ring formation regulator EzrA [Bacillus safensis]MBQ4842874.1 septation ring formation regulator EzrA [Bacillus safensis]MBQ4873798.1 septation ring formation regulator EzrA [Bacillus safensis]
MINKQTFKTVLCSTLLITGIGFSQQSFAAESNSLEKEAIKQHKISGMSDKEITELIKTAKDDRKFAETKGDELYKKDQKEFKQLETSGQIDKLYPKYKVEKNKISALSTKKSMGTKGDVLVSYEINSGSASIGVGHAAIVAQNSSNTVESWAKSYSPKKQDGVRKYPNTWNTKKKVYGLWVKGSSNAKYIGAAKYAEKQASNKKPYNWNFLNKNTTKSFYCSQLAWRAWKNQGIDIDNIKWDTIVTPMELVKSNNTKIFKHNK